jgi:hypothetical protein
MFGIEMKKVKAAFEQFKQDIPGLPPSQDPVVQAIVKFIISLSQAFG